MNARVLSWTIGICAIVLILLLAILEFDSDSDKRTELVKDGEASKIAAVDQEALSEPIDRQVSEAETGIQPSETLDKAPEPEVNDGSKEEVLGTQPVLGVGTRPVAAERTAEIEASGRLNPDSPAKPSDGSTTMQIDDSGDVEEAKAASTLNDDRTTPDSQTVAEQQRERIDSPNVDSADGSETSDPIEAESGDSDSDDNLARGLPTSPVVEVDEAGGERAVTQDQDSGSADRATENETVEGSTTLAAVDANWDERPSGNITTISLPSDLAAPDGVVTSDSNNRIGGVFVPLSKPRRDASVEATDLVQETPTVSAPSLPEPDTKEPDLLSAATTLPQLSGVLGAASEPASAGERDGIFIPMPKPRTGRNRQTSADPELEQPDALQPEAASLEQQSVIAALPEVRRIQGAEVSVTEPRMEPLSGATEDTVGKEPDQAVELSALQSPAIEQASDLSGPESLPAIPTVPTEDELGTNASGSVKDGGSEADQSTVPDNSEGSPTFDIVRVDRDGQTVIAGTARPNTKVEVLLDGVVVGEASSDATGQFVAVVFANLSGSAQRLQLRSLLPESDERVSAQDLNVDFAPRIASNIRALSNPVIAGENTLAASAESNSEVNRDYSSRDSSKTVTTPERLNSAATESPPIQRHTVSAPVIILPAQQADAAPTLVQSRPEGLAMLQPAEREILGVVLDSISYDESGAVILSGRGVVERVIRIYANGKEAGIARVDPDGRWVWASEVEDPQNIKLFRMDELGPEGSVTSRIETPFRYDRSTPKFVREREVEIQRGDMLWRIAEQYYGAGIRFSMIFSANSELIRDPDLIYPGQVFTIPELVDAN